MKKFLSVLFTVLLILSFTASSVLAASERKSVTLVSVSYQDGGIILIFETSGLTKADLKDRSFYADSNYHKMYCNFVDDTTKVRCGVTKKLAGKGEFLVTLAGFGFWGELPKGGECGSDEVVWVSITLYVEGESVSLDMPQSEWDLAVSNGITEFFTQLGIDYDISAEFCAPNWELES